MMDFIKNGSKIKILKIPHILTKFSKYSMLDHIYFSMCIFTVQGLLENGKCREMGLKLKYMISIILAAISKKWFPLWCGAFCEPHLPNTYIPLFKVYFHHTGCPKKWKMPWNGLKFYVYDFNQSICWETLYGENSL